jgi:hypothetical protein
LFLSVFVCIYLGSVLSSLFLGAGPARGSSLARLVALGTITAPCLLASLVMLIRPWPMEKLLRHLVILLVTFYTGMALGAWVCKLAGTPPPSAWQMGAAALSFQGVAVPLVWLFVREHGLAVREAFGFRQVLLPAIAAGALAAALFVPLGWGLQQLSAFLMQHLPLLQLKAVEQETVQTLRLASSPFQRITLGVVTVLIAPVGEELLFRGVLYTWIRQTGFTGLALWTSSILFAVVHFNLATFLPLLCLALLLGWLYERSGNLLTSIVAHAMFNALNFLLLLVTSS